METIDQIRIPGTQAVVPNAVYTNPDIIETYSGDMNVERVFLFQRYGLPWEDEVVEAVVSVARLLLQGNLKPGSEKKVPIVGDLEEAVVAAHSQLPTAVEGLVGSAEYRRILAACTPVPSRDGKVERESHFVIRQGYLPFEAIAVAESTLGRLDAGGYFRMLTDENITRRNFGERWRARVTMSGEGLPDWNRMAVLLDDQTVSSKTLEISGYLEYGDARWILEKLYEAQPTPGQLAAVPDRSDQSLIKSSIHAVGRFVNKMREHVEHVRPPDYQSMRN